MVGWLCWLVVRSLFRGSSAAEWASAPQQCRQQGLLGVQAVLGLIKDAAGAAFHGPGADLQAAVGGQAVQHDGAAVSLGDQLFVQAPAGKGPLTLGLFLFLALSGGLALVAGGAVIYARQQRA